MDALVLFGSLLILILIGMPIAISLCLSSTITILLFGTSTLLFQVRSIVTAVNSYPLLAIPLFILAGDLMYTGGLSKRLVNMVDAFLGSIKASLAYVTVIASTFFGAISGSGPATVAAIGSNVIPEMEKRGYPKDYSTALAAAAGLVGVLIPPSIPFVMYGISAEQSVSTLFIAGIIPGLLFSAGFAIVARLLYSRLGIHAETSRFDGKRAWACLKDGFWALLAPIIVLGGIYGGVFSPTEAAAISVAYAIFTGVFIYKELNFRAIVEAFTKSTRTTATCLGLVAFASTFGRLLTLQQVPNKLAQMLLSISDNKIIILFIINIFLIFVGMFMETIASIIILTPILLPVVTSVGVDPIMFGVVMTANLAIGFCTPPLGVNLFVASGVSKLPVERIIKAIVPYFIVMAAALLLISYVPFISLGLPSLLK
ncbi:TRAP transporter large permease [Yanshouia hominis]|uniref:TRAP transporter large permease n=1 Tax=Yanshouia hominis TaxID=2763673 RepID=A0ABR7NER4_9FIRM|nr:TRAP transporter large permease [Yanshouia hominis]MBC8574892.1 TRAP transporter large permease [Yanshouia hominis]